MSVQIVDRCYLLIDGEMVVCDSITEDIDPETKEVPAMTRDNTVLGFAQGNLKLKLAADLAVRADNEIKYRDMARTKKEFTSVLEYEGGDSLSYIDCVIGQLSIKSKTGDHVSMSLSILARDFVEN